MHYVILCDGCRVRMFLSGNQGDQIARFAQDHIYHGVRIADHEDHPEGVSEWDGSWGHPESRSSIVDAWKPHEKEV